MIPEFPEMRISVSRQNLGMSLPRLYEMGHGEQSAEDNTESANNDIGNP